MAETTCDSVSRLELVHDSHGNWQPDLLAHVRMFMALCVGWALCLSPVTGSAGNPDAVSFSNPNNITIQGLGAADLYPSIIMVSGLTSTVQKVTVILSNMTHSFPDDVDILVVGPQGQTAMIMSDAGGGNQLFNMSFTLDDDAIEVLPDNGQILNGRRYRPKNHSIIQDVLPDPAPLGPHMDVLDVFRGTNPNGAWSLYVADDFDFDDGAIAGGWALEIVGLEPFTDLALDQIVDEGPVGLGSNINYLVTINNVGPSVATGVLYTNLLPDEVSFIAIWSSQGSCVLNGPVLVCDLGTLPVGGLLYLVLKVRANVPGMVINAPGVSSDQLDLFPENNGSASSTLVSPVVDLVLAAEFPDAIFFGDTLMISLTVSNESVNLASDIQLTDLIPEFLILQSAVLTQGGCVTQSGTLACDLGSLAGHAAATMDLVFLTTRPGMYTNRFSVVSDGIEGDGMNNMIETVTAVSPSARLTLSGDAVPNPALLSQPSSLFFNISNAGPSVAGQVFFTNSLPENVGIDEILVSQGECMDRGEGMIDCDLGSLEVDAFAMIEIKVSAFESGMLTNRARVVASVADPFPADNDLETILVIKPAANLVLTLSPFPGELSVGVPVTYDIGVTNMGPSSASAVTMTNLVPAAFQFVTITSSQGICFANVGLISCDLGSVPVGAGVAIRVEMIPTQPGQVMNTVFIGGTEDDVDLFNNEIAVSGLIIQPHDPFTNTNPLMVDEEGPADVYPSTIEIDGLSVGEFRLTVTLSNLFHSFPEDLNLLLVGPGGESVMLMSDVGGGVAVTNLTVTFTDDAISLLPNSGILFSGAFLPTNVDPLNDDLIAPAPDGPYGASLGVFDGTDPNGTWSLYLYDTVLPDSGGLLGGWSLKIDTLGSAADLGVVQVASANPVEVTSNYTHTVIVTNRGPDMALGMTMIDVLPVNAVLIAVVHTGGVCRVIDGLVICEMGRLAAGDSVIVDIILNAPMTGWQTNRVKVLTSNFDSTLADHVSIEVVEVRSLEPVELFLTTYGELSWFAFPSDLILQYIDTLGPGSIWETDESPRVLEDGYYKVTVPVDEGQRFYRLIRP